MKNKKDQNEPELMLPECACSFCGFTEEETLEIHAARDVLIILRDKMTALELINAIHALSEIASGLTVDLAKACGICNHCGDEGPELCKGINECDESCASLHGCDDGPVEWVANCSLCHDLLDESQNIHIPDYILESAGIPKGTKLEAYADGGNGEITVVEAERQSGITDVPPSILAILAQSGVCLAELDELIMQEAIIYGS